MESPNDASGEETPQGPRYDALNRRLCAAKRSNGEPCNAPAMRGQRVCRSHGGSAPQARRAAAIRLAQLIDPAVATLGREMVQADTSSDRQRAANSILDRAGVPRVTKDISVEDSRAILMTRLQEIRDKRGVTTGSTTYQVVQSTGDPEDGPDPDFPDEPDDEQDDDE